MAGWRTRVLPPISAPTAPSGLTNFLFSHVLWSHPHRIVRFESVAPGVISTWRWIVTTSKWFLCVNSTSTSKYFLIRLDEILINFSFSPFLGQETLVDLLGVVGRRPRLPIVICCSSRDDLDSVSAALSGASYISLLYLVIILSPTMIEILSPRRCPNYRVQYSDQSEGERALTLNKFRKATAEWNSVCSRPLQLDGDEDHCPSHLMVITDACLPALSFAEAPLQARVLINFEVPTKVRRLALFSINSSFHGNFLA